MLEKIVWKARTEAKSSAWINEYRCALAKPRRVKFSMLTTAPSSRSLITASSICLWNAGEHGWPTRSCGIRPCCCIGPDREARKIDLNLDVDSKA